MKSHSEDCLYRECKFYNENAFGGYCSNPKKCNKKDKYNLQYK